MNEIIIFFISYFLTWIGFFLGKITIEEHEEIKNIVKKIIFIIVIIFYLFLIWIAFNSLNYISISIIITLLILYLLSRIKYDIASDTHDIILFSFTFPFLMGLGNTYNFFFILPIIFLMYENSFREFNVKDEFFKIIILVSGYLFFSYFF
jgi:hypothetical protein